MDRSSFSVRGLAAIAAVCALLCAAAASASAAPLVLESNFEQGTVSVFGAKANAEISEPISVGGRPKSIAITPNARFAYVANEESDDVSVIDLATRQLVGKPIEVGQIPGEIALSPDGEAAYVAHQSPVGITVIDTRTNRVTGEIPLAAYATGIAVSPDGSKIYVAEENAEAVEVVSTVTDKPVGSPIKLEAPPQSVAVSPDGKTVYAPVEADGLAAVDAASFQVKYYAKGVFSVGIALTPDGEAAVITDPTSEGGVFEVDLRTGSVVNKNQGGEYPLWVTVSPDGKLAYVAGGLFSQTLRVIDLQTFGEVVPPISRAGFGAGQVAVTPDQSPTAAFAAPSATPDVPATFSGAASTDPDGSVVSWDWAFGDASAGSGVTATHTYAAPGTYGAKLSVFDNEGCGEEMVFTGRTAYCSGSVAASVTHPVTAKAPAAPAPAVPIAAPAPPSNAFRFGRTVHNLRNGTVRIQVTLPSAGFVLLFGKKVHAVTRKSKGAQAMWLTLHARVELAKRLKTTLRAPVKFRVTFTPDGGTPKTVHRSVTLQRAPHGKHGHR